MVNNQENCQLRRKSRGVRRKDRCHCRPQGIPPGSVFPHRLGPGHGLAEVAAGSKISSACRLQMYLATAIHQVLPACTCFYLLLRRKFGTDLAI